jgi:hypothetical protein
VNQIVQFLDATTFCGGGSCGSASIPASRVWRWTFPGGTPPSTTVTGPAANGNTTSSFGSTGLKSILLEVRDDAIADPASYCSMTKSVTVQKVIPKWKEILPR